MFRDRVHAGGRLAAAMPDLRRRPNLTVVAVGMGGVETGAEVARQLDLPLEVVPVRKVPLPGHPQLAVGAVAPLGERYTNRRVAALLSRARLDDAYDAATAEARGADERLRGNVPLVLTGRTALIVDDGAATGASVRAAIAAARNAGARHMIVAVPVVPRPTAERLVHECERLVTLATPRRFHAVADFYESFEPVGEDRARELLAACVPQLPSPV